MCELLGLSFNEPVRCSLSFRGFRERGARNPDGWGVARYDGPACQVFKEPVNAVRSGLASFVRDYEPFRSRVSMAHVRWASRGEVALQNTHPFVRTFRGREVALAHNGTLRGLPGGSLRFHPVGSSDSELLFCRLLTRLSEPRLELTNFPEIQGVLRSFNEYGSMNLLFSDGERLFVYRDADGYNGLCVVRRQAPFAEVRLRDDDWRVDLADEKRLGQRGHVVATRPLTDERWTELTPGALVVLEGGEIVFGG
jgi:predicted glutamine amidotransferase